MVPAGDHSRGAQGNGGRLPSGEQPSGGCCDQGHADEDEEDLAGKLLREDRPSVAEPRRREILDFLSGRELAVNDLVGLLDLAQPLVSKHLRVLREVGLVDVRDEGRQRMYRVNGEPLKPIHDWVTNYEESWSQRFDRLDVVLEELKDLEDGNAPRRLVYKAWTTPELINRWWAGDRGEVTIADVDLQVGGTWRCVMTANGGFEVAFHGGYREIVPNEPVVSTEIFEAIPDVEAVVTNTFTERDGAHDPHHPCAKPEPGDP